MNRGRVVALACAVLTILPATTAAAPKSESGAQAALLGTWAIKAPMPTPRADPSVGVLNGVIHVVGGHFMSQLAVHEAYDPATDTWVSKAPRPDVGSTKSHGVIGGILYEAGGVDCCVEVNSVWAYDPVANSWSARAAMPTVRSGAAGAAVGGKLYVTGGINSIGAPGVIYSATEAYDPTSNSWMARAPMPTARRNAAAGVLDGILYVVGGANAGGVLSTLEAYDPATDTWSTRAPMPTARTDLTVSVVGSRLYAIGGFDGAGHVNTVESYEPVSNTWSPEPPMPTNRSQVRSATLGGTLHAIGGGNATGRVPANEAFTPIVVAPPPLPSNGRIAFHSTRDGDAEIYAMNPDGSGQTQLTINTATDSVPAWSPDGSKIAFTSDRDGNAEIYVMNADGTGQTRLTTNPALETHASWSPDGSKIAFVSTRDGNEEIYVMSVDGSGQTRLTAHGAQDSEPTWSPDGTKIAFISLRDAGAWDTYAMNANGSAVTRLTTHPADDLNPDWSPDGLKIAFFSNRDGNGELYSMNADGTVQTRLTTNAASDTSPAWSPDGTKIAFTSDRDGNPEIYSMGADGSGQTRLTTNPAADDAADWGTAAITPPPPPPACTVVTNTSDSGTGSLRAAIQCANSNAGPDTITFAIPPIDPGFNGQWSTIKPLSPLPQLTDDGTTIDGSTQPNTNAFGPEIELNGALAGPAIGLLVESTGNTIHSLTVNGFQAGAPGTGLGIQFRRSGNTVTGSYVGLDPTGTAAVPNAETGVSVGNNSGANRIGGPTPAERNVISGNRNIGVLVGQGNDGTVVEGNYIGTNAAGTAAVANGSGTGGDAGIHVQSNGTMIGGNVVSGNNGPGIGMFFPAPAGNTVRGNYIGTNASGVAAIPNSSDGVSVSGPGNTIGGPGAGDRNVISGNANQGISIFSGGSNVVEGNYIGTNVSGTAAVPNGRGGVSVDRAPNSAVRGNVISGNVGDGVTIRGEGATGNVVEGNFIGTDATGNAPLPNTRFAPGGGGGFGIILHHASGNTIGGTTPAARNVISGNEQAGIQLGDPLQFGGASDVSDNVVQGNYIGTNASGTAAIGNGTVGVFVFGPNNRIGGTSSGARNVVSGNAQAGVQLSLGQATGNVVEGNYIGTNAAGTAPIGNQQGVSIDSSSSNTVGGTAAGAGNLISGNAGPGVGVNSGSNITVHGNRIGTDAPGTNAIPNRTGVLLFNANGVLIGGPAPGTRNVISGNSTLGVSVARGNVGVVVRGNYVGTDATGTVALGNATGVAVGDPAVPPANTLIAQNVVSGNGQAGVEVGIGGPAPGTRIEANLIGTNAAGNAALANGIGIRLSGADHVVRDNVVSGNTGAGISAAGATNLLIAGNKVGTDVAGTAALGNGQQGALLGTNGPQGVTNSTVGGPTAADRNVVSGNGRDGIRLAGPATSGNTVRGNYVGVDATGTAALGNAAAGIVVFNLGADAAQGNTIADNVVSANGAPTLQFTGGGVMIRGPGARGNTVQANRIGTDAAGNPGLGNRLGGVVIDFGAHDNLVGGSAAGASNVIASNRGAGVMLGACEGDSTVRNRISRNSIFGNVPGTAPGCGDAEIPAIGLGIDLGEDGVTPNDPGDVDTGPNELMNFPVLEKTKAKNKVTHIEGTIDTPNPQTVLIEIFLNPAGADPSGFGEGMTFFGSVMAKADGTFELQLPPIADDTMITATATDAAGNTSEFSEAVPAK